VINPFKHGLASLDELRGYRKAEGIIFCLETSDSLSRRGRCPVASE
jgi:hypothetical protein